MAIVNFASSLNTSQNVGSFALKSGVNFTFCFTSSFDSKMRSSIRLGLLFDWNYFSIQILKHYNTRTIRTETLIAESV